MGVAAAGIAVDIGGMIGGAAQAKALAKAQKKIAKWQIASRERIAEGGAIEREKYSQMSQGYQDIAARNLVASEEAKVTLMSMMGQPGTYGGRDTGGRVTLGSLAPGGLTNFGGGGGGLLGGRISSSGSVSRKDIAKLAGSKEGRYKGKMKWEVSGLGLDADSMASAAANTSGFRAVSGMVAEAEQFQNRQGTLWNQLSQSIVGGIYESSAAIHKNMLENVARNMAQGGYARRVGLQMAQVMQAQEGTNRTRTASLWQARTALEEYRAQRVEDITTYSQDWVNNQSGIRDSFVKSLNDIQMHWADTLPPSLISASLGAQQANMAGIAQGAQGLNAALKTKNDGIMASIEGITSLATSAIGMMETTPTLTASGGSAPFHSTGPAGFQTLNPGQGVLAP